MGWEKRQTASEAKWRALYSAVRSAGVSIAATSWSMCSSDVSRKGTCPLSSRTSNDEPCGSVCVRTPAAVRREKIAGVCVTNSTAVGHRGCSVCRLGH